MLIAIRLLTLITFTTHVVLGCCLSHGRCDSNLAETSTIAGCDNPGHTDGPAEHEHHGTGCEFQVHEAHGQLCLGGEEQSNNPGHKHHCGDIHCVFGVSQHAGNTVSSLRGLSVLWYGHPRETIAHTLRSGGNRDAYRDRLPPSFCNRAMRQLWLI